MFTEFTIFFFTILEPLHQASTQNHPHQFMHWNSHYLYKNYTEMGSKVKSLETHMDSLYVHAHLCFKGH